MEKMVEVERATQDELRQDLKSLFQGAIRLTLEMVLEEELKAMVGARRFERVGSRKGHRNGTYLRRLLTSLGQIDVTVPRSREGGSPADVMGRYQRRSEEVDAMMVEAYVSGVSQRKMGDVTEALMGERVGRSTVSRVAKRLDEGVQTLRSAPIEGAHPYLEHPIRHGARSPHRCVRRHLDLATLPGAPAPEPWPLHTQRVAPRLPPSSGPPGSLSRRSAWPVRQVNHTTLPAIPHRVVFRS